MLHKDDPAFKKLVDDTLIGLMKSGEFEKMYNKWFMQPIPPRGMPLNLPMSPQLRENIQSPSDKPAT
jgi:glutamate/aspartate transport system substrate-binding protein